ncbi:MAG TPA: hypothetical protein DDY98_03555 [Ruminococcaceae bacterium]|nr:hypothetical protein [Oscillospiraceae bacterium]
MKNLSFPSVRDLIEEKAEKSGDAVFLKFIRNEKIEERTFRRVRDDSLAFCRMIRHYSTEKLHIALIGETGYEYIISLTGILISGCVAVPFSPDISVREAAMLFDRADIDVLIHDATFSTKADELKKCCPRVKEFINIGNFADMERLFSVYSSDSEYASLSDYEVDKTECAAIIFTSGTTGERKGVMLSTDSMVGNIMYRDLCADVFRSGDVALSILPMYHTFCFTGDFIKNLKDGLQVCLNGNMRDLMNNLLIFEPRVMRVVPMVADSLLRRMKMLQARNPDITNETAVKEVFGSNIRHLISGGAYLNPELCEEYAKYGIFLRQGYGMTEAGCRISVPDEAIDPASVGRIIEICEARVSNGEIQVKTPTIMMGYYKMPKETAEMFTEDGWLKTGDIGYITEDRQLFITGRVKNLIILSSGENVSPEAIEKRFADYPLVKEILVYAENDRIVAQVYPDYELAEKQGIADIAAEINTLIDSINLKAKASHFISEVIVRTEPLERTESGKIKRKETVL